jgi:hypothetical protein
VKFIYFNGKDEYSHTRCGWVFPKGVAITRRCAGFPIRWQHSDGWGYPAKGAEG